MARKKKIVEVVMQRRLGLPVGGPVSINFEASDAEKAEAFDGLLAAVLKVSEMYGLETRLREVAEDIVKTPAAAK